MVAMQRRYPGPDGPAWSPWWTDLADACDELKATWGDGTCLIEGEHADREPVATRLISELLAEALQ